MAEEGNFSHAGIATADEAEGRDIQTVLDAATPRQFEDFVRGLMQIAQARSGPADWTPQPLD